jgi:ATPase subunit of ABC transporter with duplicated ATPase domains
MAHLVGVDQIKLRFGTRTLFDGVTLGIDDGDRIGIVGPNGAGKSTLLKLLAGRIEPDAGRVTKVGGLTIGLLDQRDLEAPGKSIIDVVHGDAAEYTWASDAMIREIHAGLLPDLAPDQLVDTLSGGQRRRVALAALLASNPDLLLLDEPSNHLDVEGVDWLARYLSVRYGKPGAQGALVVVTHDRWFLDAVGSRMWEVVSSAASGTPTGFGGGVEQYEGGYAAYILARAERARQASVATEKRNNLLRKELAWLRRGAPARTSKPKFRLDAASELIADEPPPRDSMELTKLATRRLGKDVIELKDVSLWFDANGRHKEILDYQNWNLGPGDRFGIVGVNGAGKTTLLALLSGRLAPNSGVVKRGKTVQVAELTQATSELDNLGDLTAVRLIEREKGTISVAADGAAFMARTSVGSNKIAEISASQLTERLGFSRERAHTRISELSGGERRRLQLARLLIMQPNVLLLDEPTNDLDTDTLAAIEDLLDSWSGTLVVVSHDRYLLERITDRQWAMYGDGKIVDLPGGVDAYLAKRRALETELQQSVGSGFGNEAKPVTASAASQSEIRQARKDLARIEKQLDKIDKSVAKLHAQIADNPTDIGKVSEASGKLTELANERDELELEWLQAAELAS